MTRLVPPSLEWMRIRFFQWTTIIVKRVPPLQTRGCFECRLCVLIARLIKSTHPINCEGQLNAFYFRDLPVAGTNNGRHGNSGIPVVVSDHRNGSYFRHYLAGRLDFDSGPALDGIDVS